MVSSADSRVAPPVPSREKAGHRHRRWRPRRRDAEGDVQQCHAAGAVEGSPMKFPKYLVIYEREGKSYGAFVPDLPGCVATGRTLPVVKKRIREAIAMHLEDMLDRGETLPVPAAESEYVKAVPA